MIGPLMYIDVYWLNFSSLVNRKHCNCDSVVNVTTCMFPEQNIEWKKKKKSWPYTC